MCVLKRLLFFGSMGFVCQLRFCIAPYWVSGPYFPPVDNIAKFRKYFHSYLREVHFGACAVQAVDWRAEHGDVTRERSASHKLERSQLPRPWKDVCCSAPSESSGFFLPRLGLHRRSCSSVFHCYNFVLKVCRSKVWKQMKNLLFSKVLFYFIFAC